MGWGGVGWGGVGWGGVGWGGVRWGFEGLGAQVKVTRRPRRKRIVRHAEQRELRCRIVTVESLLVKWEKTPRRMMHGKPSGCDTWGNTWVVVV